MTTFFYLGAIVCLAIIVIAFKKPDMLVHLEKVHKNFIGMTKAKALATFIPVFIIFLVLGAMVSGDKNSEKKGSELKVVETHGGCASLNHTNIENLIENIREQTILGSDRINI
ncbi:MAG: hypothetical protein KBF93_15615 [Leptospiraceae bacterium]|nr:hypothetical protein [Leptospiraceae bacterium]